MIVHQDRERGPIELAGDSAEIIAVAGLLPPRSFARWRITSEVVLRCLLTQCPSSSVVVGESLFTKLVTGAISATVDTEDIALRSSGYLPAIEHTGIIAIDDTPAQTKKAVVDDILGSYTLANWHDLR